MSIRFTFVDVEAGANIVIARKSALVSRNDELGYRLSTVGVTIPEEEVAMSDIGTVVHSDPDILGGTPVFHGTRVPFRNLIDYLERGYSVEEFLDAFPSVTREQVITSLEAAHEALSVRARAAR